MKTRVVSTEDLKQYIADESPASILYGLYEQQKQKWPLLNKGVTALNNIKTKSLLWYGDEITVQFNPIRSVSITANVDPSFLQTRACFLCLENLPPEQTGILIDSEFIALANPMPIFPAHFTIAHAQHKNQEIVGSVEALLQITKKLNGRFTVFFNGATAGASAPNHFHFQACPKGSLPITEIARSKADKKSRVGTILTVNIDTLSFFGNRYVLLCGPAFEDIVTVLERLIYLLDNNHPCGKDMLNIIVDYNANGWQVVFIPREKHRPDCFYEEGDSSLLISPGAVEMGGVLITAREEDFFKITSQDARNIYEEVTLNNNAYNIVLDAIFKG